MKTITEPQREIPVVREIDVVVAGGGPAGIVAAIAAARAGADTLLVERYGYLGGMITGSWVTAIYGFGSRQRQLILGIPQDMVDRLSECGAWEVLEDYKPAGDGCTDAEMFKWVSLEMLQEAGAEVLLHSWVVDAITEDDEVKGIIVENKSGRQALLAQVTVDATADGDIAKFAGAAYQTRDDYVSVSERDGLFGRDKLPHTLGVRIDGVDRDAVERFREQKPEQYAQLMAQLEQQGGGLDLHACGTADGDALDAWDLTRMEIEGRTKIMTSLLFLRENLPGYESAHVADTTPQFGVREGRRIVGEYTLSIEDMAQAKKFDDGICRCGSSAEGEEYDIPYRCLVTEKVDNLLAAGRCISIGPEAHLSLRGIAPCMGTGHAAGAAAALAARAKVKPRNLDIGQLRELLIEQGAYLGQPGG